MNDTNTPRTKTAVCRQPNSIARRLALGAGVGAALMSATGKPAMLAAGIAVGLMVSYAVDLWRSRKP